MQALLLQFVRAENFPNVSIALVQSLAILLRQCL